MNARDTYIQNRLKEYHDATHLLNTDQVTQIKALEELVDRATLGIFKKLHHDDTGRYSDDGGIHFNKLGLEKQDKLFTAQNKIREAFEMLKSL